MRTFLVAALALLAASLLQPGVLGSREGVATGIVTMTNSSGAIGVCSSGGVAAVTIEATIGQVTVVGTGPCFDLVPADVYGPSNCAFADDGDVSCSYALASGTRSNLALSGAGRLQYTYAHATAGTWGMTGTLARADVTSNLV